MLWLLIALLSAAVLGLFAWTLRRSGAVQGPESDLAVYRDQLAELDRDVARGLMPETEAASARLEIQRRLLAAAERDGKTAASARSMPRATMLILALGVAVAVGVFVAVTVTAGVAVLVAVAVVTAVGVAVAVCVTAPVGVGVAVLVEVAVGVGLPVLVGVALGVGFAVEVGVAVGVILDVGVGVGPPLLNP